MVDRDQERKLLRLIPLAEEEAKKKVLKHKSSTWIEPGVDGELYKFDYFSQYFHQAMNRMAKEDGLRC